MTPSPARLWSPDGRYYLRRTGSVIEIVDATTEALVQAIAAGGGDAVWAPDSRSIAIATEEGDLSIAGIEVSRPSVKVAGGIGSHTNPYLPFEPVISWAPDSSHLAYTRDGQIWVADAVSGAAKLRVDAAFPILAEPRWSPDGLSLAFRAEAELGVYVARPDGSGVRYLTPGSDAAVSPSGETLTYRFNAGVYSVRPDGGGRQVIAETVARFGDLPPFCGPTFSQEWSPDGKKVAIQWYALNGRGDIVVVDSGGGPEAFRLDGFSPRWSPDGSRIGFAANTVRDALLAPPANDICSTHIITPAGGEVAVVPGRAQGWLPDGTLVVSEQGATVVYDRDGRELRRLAANAILSPSGGYYTVYESFRTPGEGDSSSPDSRFRLYDASGTALRTFEHAAPHGFSPDGRQLAYGERQPFQPDETLFLLDLTDPAADPRRVLTARAIDLATWSPDSKKLAFVQRFPDRLPLLRVLDTANLRIADIAEDVRSLRWFPDSGRLVYSAP